MDKDETLDAFGLYCPMPIIKTSQAILELEIGQVLEVLADDEGTKRDMPQWCQNTGHELLEVEEEDGEIRFYIKKLV